MIEKVCGRYGIPVSEIAKNHWAGEMYEELMTEDEARYAVEYDDMYAIQPIIGAARAINKFPKSYRSDEQVILHKHNILNLV